MPFSWLDRLRPPLLLVLVLGLVAITRPAHATETAGPASAFTDLPLAEATARAAAEGKLLLLYFTATWCAPCRQMEATTWRDPTVLAHLRDRAIVVKCDSDLAKDLARDHVIDGYPTLVILHPDGRELERIDGYRGPADFIAAFDAGLDGLAAIERARATVVRAQADPPLIPLARFRLGRTLARAGQDEAGLAELLWCWDTGIARDGSLADLRRSALLSELARHTLRYPPARTALQARRDQVEQRYLATGSGDDLQDLIALNRALLREHDTVALHQRLEEGSPQKGLLGYALFDQLYLARRYAEAAEIRPLAWVLNSWSRLAAETQSADFLAKTPAEQRDRRRFLIGWIGKHLTVLAGAGRDDDTRRLFTTALAYDASPTARDRYRQALEKAGRADLMDSPP